MLGFCKQSHALPRINNRVPTALVIGFYDRKNAGDEMYKVAMPMIFGRAVNLTFVCMDDIEVLPADDKIDFVICGGGDIINAYFMTKAERLLAKYTGRVYAFSVGVPYPSDAKYLHLFDHVFVRSLHDYDVAIPEIGSKNVSYLPDAAMVLAGGADAAAAAPTYSNAFMLGVCLAQPAFAHNPVAGQLLDTIVAQLVSLRQSVPTLRVHLISFNYGANADESDLGLNREIADRLGDGFPVVVPTLTDPMAIFKYLAMMDAVVCMRYHSLVFSHILRKRIVALYCSPKVDRLVADIADIADISGTHVQAYKLPVDEVGRPASIDGDRLYGMLSNAAAALNATTSLEPLEVVDWSLAKGIMIFSKKRANLLLKRDTLTLESTLSECRRILPPYLGIEAPEFDALMLRTGILPTYGHTHADIARLVCFIITKSMQSACLWGLIDNMATETFCLRDAIVYIWKDFYEEAILPREAAAEEVYYPQIPIRRRALVSLDGVFTNDFKNYHRSGWAYAVGGLMNINAQQLLRSTNHHVMIDSYLDRSFHWGLDTLKAVGVVPYTKPWIGFVHHTFHTGHSSYNCVELFANPDFIASLSCCRGLISLTEYLASTLRQALAGCGFSNVPVHVVMHPMENVDNLFTMEKFLANGDRKLVQVGAWLRDAYSIYNLYMWNNRLSLQKCALKGKDMNNYFSPEGLLPRIETILLEDTSPPAPGSDGICRAANNTNKYGVGLFDLIASNDASVRIIDRLTNEEYDELLAYNLVYLKLVDCSAVNTVLECLVRNTPLIVNRHPAVEEILGKTYPCFYLTDLDATILINDLDRIRAGHLHLKNMEKSRFGLQSFVDSVQAIVANTV